MVHSTPVLTVRSDALYKIYKAVTKPERVIIPKPIRKHYNFHLFG